MANELIKLVLKSGKDQSLKRFHPGFFRVLSKQYMVNLKKESW